MARFPGCHVVRRQGVVGVGLALLAGVYDHGGLDQFFGRVLVNGSAVGVEAGRGGEVGSGVFAQGEAAEVVAVAGDFGPVRELRRRVAGP